ncbi:TPA: bestrophin family ion channel [Escherichia coli]
MIVRPQQHWLRRIFVWHGSVLSKISSRLLLNFLFSIAVIFMLPWYTHLGIKFTLAPFSILGVAIAIFLGFRNNAGYARYVEARKLWGQLMIASRSLLLPLDAICNAIEIDLLQMNDETEIPAKILPDRHYQLT